MYIHHSFFIHSSVDERLGCFHVLSESSESEVAQSCPILCNPVDCGLPGSSIRGILQARVLEWGAIYEVDFFKSVEVSTFRISEANLEITKEISIEGIKSTLVWAPRAHWQNALRGKHVCIKMFHFHSFVFDFWENCHVLRSEKYPMLSQPGKSLFSFQRASGETHLSYWASKYETWDWSSAYHPIPHSKPQQKS